MQSALCMRYSSSVSLVRKTKKGNKSKCRNEGKPTSRARLSPPKTHVYDPPSAGAKPGVRPTPRHMPKGVDGHYQCHYVYVYGNCVSLKLAVGSRLLWRLEGMAHAGPLGVFPSVSFTNRGKVSVGSASPPIRPFLRRPRNAEKKAKQSFRPECTDQARPTVGGQSQTPSSPNQDTECVKEVLTMNAITRYIYSNPPLS